MAFANQLSAELADPTLPADWRGPFAKMDGYGARAALILHLGRVVCEEADTEDVDQPSVRAMVRLMDYFKAHAQRVYARLRRTPADQRADQACRWIRAAGGWCTGRERQRYRVAGVRRASEADTLVRDLLDLGHGHMEERRLPSGRTQRVFVLHANDVEEPTSSTARHVPKTSANACARRRLVSTVQGRYTGSAGLCPTARAAGALRTREAVASTPHRCHRPATEAPHPQEFSRASVAFERYWNAGSTSRASSSIADRISATWSVWPEMASSCTPTSA
jgi:hypothetical protein